jgi:methylamine utilization protein MauE
MVNIEISCRCLLAIVFACSAGAKLRGGGSFRAFRDWLGDLPVPGAAHHAGGLAAALASAEVLIVLLLVLPWTVRPGFALAGATLLVFIAGTRLAITRGTNAACNCFGARGAPLGWRHVVRDAVLLAVAVLGAVASDAHGARVAGVAVSVATAAFLSVLIVFLDDVMSLLAVGSPEVPG